MTFLVGNPKQAAILKEAVVNKMVEYYKAKHAQWLNGDRKECRKHGKANLR